MQTLSVKTREQTDNFELREKDLQMALEDARQTEIKVYEKMRQLENHLDASIQVIGLKFVIELVIFSIKDYNADFAAQSRLLCFQ